MNDDKSLDELLRELEQLKRTAPMPNKRKRRIPSGWIVLAVALLIAGTAVAATILFVHTAPTVTVPTAIATSTCTTLSLLSLSAVQSVGGIATFSCAGVAGTPAISGQSTNSLPFSVTTLGGYSSVWLYVNTTQPSGTACSGTQLVGSGTYPFSAGTSYNYCAVIPPNVASPAAFSVSWSQ